MKKIFTLALLLVCSVAFTDDTKVVVAKPGAILELYNASVKEVRPSKENHITTITDLGKQFCHDNVTLYNETKNLRQQYLFKVWTGYITIPEAGEYVVSLSYDIYKPHTYWGPNPNSENTILDIAGRNILYIHKVYTRQDKPKLNASARVTFQKGSYEVKITHRSNYVNDRFTLKIWNRKTPLKKMIITPCDMSHVE